MIPMEEPQKRLHLSVRRVAPFMSSCLDKGLSLLSQNIILTNDIPHVYKRLSIALPGHS